MRQGYRESATRIQGSTLSFAARNRRVCLVIRGLSAPARRANHTPRWCSCALHASVRPSSIDDRTVALQEPCGFHWPQHRAHPPDLVSGRRRNCRFHDRTTAQKLPFLGAQRNTTYQSTYRLILAPTGILRYSLEIALEVADDDEAMAATLGDHVCGPGRLAGPTRARARRAARRCPARLGDDRAPAAQDGERDQQARTRHRGILHSAHAVSGGRSSPARPRITARRGRWARRSGTRSRCHRRRAG